MVFVAHGFYMGVPAQYDFTFLWGRWGVCFFFVLSGFIIAHVHWRDIGAPSQTPNFLWRRFIRIFPTYWLALCVFIAVRNGLGNPDYRLVFTPIELAGNVALWPGFPDLLVPMAWTLRHELLFYTLFALAIVDKRLGLAAFSIWLALLLWNVAHQTPCEMLTIAAQRCMAQNSNTTPTSPAWFLLTANVNLYFFVGMGLALAFRANAIGRVTAISAAICAASFFIDRSIESTYALALSQASAFSTLVSLAIWLSTKIRAPAFALWFGDISYVFYLFHMTVMLMAHGLLKRLSLQLPWQVEPVIALLLALLASHVITKYFERPVRERLSRRKARGAIEQSPQPL